MIEVAWKRDLARRFGAAAQSYETQSEVQQKSARALAGYIAAKIQNKKPLRILEIGCGTGYLTRELLKLYPDAQWWVTDISADMLTKCKSSLSDKVTNPEYSQDSISHSFTYVLDHSKIQFHAMDGEAVDLDGPFDLICSNMAFQWFHDLEGTLGKLSDLLSTDGMLAFSTLSQGTFGLWHKCQNELGIERLAPEFPGAVFYHDCLGGLNVDTQQQKFVQCHKDGLDFLRTLREIGAHSSRVGRSSLSIIELRALLKKYESCFTDGHIEADYDVVFVLCSKNGEN
ncbi:methyltransferase domain-containing protein [uncultured Kiloniella sp.]|uniref:methyltransferase domain-containing protein n=1 Tax=uncultured Kiloniella sp. TaxID=1133091 RepID=UPI00261638EA|nr:methyltransferase domain-containing protein [uncultured Kiloniella sp.]